ncbi:MAG: hypothetical protein ACR2ML_06965 [Solirubrobacteraceae bacterium]
MTVGKESMKVTLGKGVAAGLAGAAVMTAFQKLVEMPLTGRGDSYAPADLAEKLFPMPKKRGSERQLRNYVTHFALGAGWGVARGLLGRAGLSGQPAVAAVFGVMYPGDIAIVAGLGLDRPLEWSARDWAIDTVDKLVLALATGLAYESLERI